MSNNNGGSTPITDEKCKIALRYVKKHGNANKAAKAEKIPLTTLRRWLNAAKVKGIEQEMPPVTMPDIPDDDIPVTEIIDLQKRRFEKRQTHKQAKSWFSVKVNIDGPIGLAFVGDPHLDDDGCNWTALDRDIGIMRDTEGLLACNIGDTTNNWVGRLRTLYANQEMSAKTGYKLAKWFLAESGVPWFIWLLGNHDMWNDGSEIFRQMGATLVEMERKAFPDTTVEEWQAQFKLTFKNGREVPIWASHDFPGHSQWNSLHSLQKAAHMKASAALYVAGHKHNWALHQEESASRGFVYWLARARGYKYIDQHGELLGHESQQEGATILAVIDPESKSMAGTVQCFADMEEGADYLTWKRSK